MLFSPSSACSGKLTNLTTLFRLEVEVRSYHFKHPLTHQDHTWAAVVLYYLVSIFLVCSILKWYLSRRNNVSLIHLMLEVETVLLS